MLIIGLNQRLELTKTHHAVLFTVTISEKVQNYHDFPLDTMICQKKVTILLQLFRHFYCKIMGNFFTIIWFKLMWLTFSVIYQEQLVHRCSILFLKLKSYSNFGKIFIMLTDIQLLKTTYDPVLHKCQSCPNANSSKESFAVSVAMTSRFLDCHSRPDWYQGGIQSTKSPACVESHPVDVRWD